MYNFQNCFNLNKSKLEIKECDTSEKKLNTTYNTNPRNIFNKIAFTFPNLMTLDISD